MANILFQSTKRGNIIEEGRRVLKSGGELIIIDWNKGTGGFGPPNDIRPDIEDIKKMTKSEGFTFEQSIDAGSFHFGLLFKKP
jgi:ubiquinone/menaquinone biosynthesis C-methylase UbiE